ncbi:MAG: carboxypeptidase-like regulatory domain-containing protein [Planctomycetota bacterium]|jgi:uncharacterized GH25 family protein
MKPAHLIVVAALVAVGALLYLAFDPGLDRGGQRGEGAAGESRGTKREAAQSPGSDHGAQPDGTTGVFIQVHPAGVAEVILTGPRNWRGRTDEDGSAFAGWMAPGRYAVSAHRGALAAAKTFDVEERTTVELHLDESIAVRGHVFDAAGRAIAGAVVQAMPESERTGVHPGWRISWLAANARPPIYAETVTDETGAYAIHVPAARYTLEARASGFAGMNQSARLYDRKTDGIDFYLHPGARVAGRVVGPDEQPVDGALVVVTAGQQVTTLAYSGADGAFSLDVPATGWNQLAVRAHGYAPAMYGSIRPPISGLTVRIDRGVSVRAKLIIAGTGGQPAVGVDAYLSFSGGGRATLSDSEGVVTFPLVSTRGSTMNWMNLMLAGGGFVPVLQSVNGKLPVDGVVDLGEIELEPGATIRGRVTDRTTGAAIEGADVRWFSPSLRGVARNAVAGSTSDSDGRFELSGVADDAVAVIAMKEGYAPSLDRATVWKRVRDKQARVLSPGQTLLEHDVELAASGAVTGLALDPLGKPLAGVVVRGPRRREMVGDMTRPTAVTDTDGRFELGGFADGTKLALDAHHVRYGSAKPARLIAGDGTEPTFRFHQPVRVVGRVVDPNGNPVAQASVVAGKPPKRGRQQFEPDSPRATTDAGGRFVLRTVPPEERELKVTHDLFLIRTEPLALSPDKRDHDAGELRLERGPGIEGHVLHEDNTPVAGATVTLTYERPDSMARAETGAGERLFVNLSADAQGHFAAYGLRQGNYRVRAGVRGLFAEQPVVSTGTTDVVVVARKGKVWRGRIVVAGEPVERASVSAQFAGQNAWISSGSSAKDGSVSLENLPPSGPFDLHVKHRDYKDLKLADTTVAALPKEIALDHGAVIRGVVVDTNDKPIARANIQARPVEGTGFRWAQSKEDGSFVLGGLDEQKRYSVKISGTRDQHVPGDPIEAQPGGEPLRFELEQGLTISGKINTRSAEELGNVRVVAIDAQGKQRATAWVFAPQRLEFKLRALRAGPYTLRLLSGWGESEETLAELAGVETGATNVEIAADG